MTRAVQTALAGAGGVLQVVQVNTTSYVDTSSTSFVDATGYTATITPTSTTSKILVVVACTAGSPANAACWVQVLRGSTVIGACPAYTGQPGNPTYMPLPVNISYLDSPATTSATTYKLQFRADSATSVRLGAPLNPGYGQGTATWTNSITLLEIAG